MKATGFVSDPIGPARKRQGKCGKGYSSRPLSVILSDISAISCRFAFGEWVEKAGSQRTLDEEISENLLISR